MHKNSIIKNAHVILTKYLVTFVLILLPLFTRNVIAQESSSYDEISVFLNVPRVGGGEIDAVIIGDKLYLPVTDLFDFLKIRNTPDPDLKSISGFFVDPAATYEISRTNKIITYQGKTYNLQPEDIIRTESNLYLLSSYFGKIFGLECTFDFRSLSVSVNSKLELPLIREMRQEEMRKNLKHLKGETKADTIIGRTYPGFKFGMADWSVNSSQEIKGKSSTQLNLALGAMVAGGEATTSIYYNSSNAFNWKYQNYLWRYVNNDFAPLRQISAGKISTNAVSTLFSPVVGVQFTNTPTTYRRSFGSYTLSDYTDPGWIVELYVNNVLVDYVKADASGFFTFEVPLVYGNTIVNLKFIGPWGEEKTKEQNFNIPFTFLPVKTFEYTASAGLVEDSLNSKFSRVSVNYGLSKNMTIGGGAEYLSSLSSGPLIPYVNTSVKITNNLLLTSEYAYGVRSKSTLTYRLPSNMQLDLNYSWYQKGQTAIKYNYREERKATLSVPLHIGKLSTYQRFSLNQIVMPASKYTTGEWLFSGSVLNINTNLTTYALFVTNTSPTIYSNLALSFRLPAGIVCMPQVQYGYSQQKLLTARLELQKHLSPKAYLDLSFEHNRASNLNTAQLQFRYDFSFAQAGFIASRSNKKTLFSQYARGSLINDRKTKYLGFDNRTNVGKGGVSIIAFLDLNSNGKHDKGEPKVNGLNLHANGGRVEKDDRDSTIRILGLEPYTSCFIELDPNSFENVSWRLPVKTLNVMVDPNILKTIEIPVSVVGEATGNVFFIKNGEKAGQGRMIVDVYSGSLKLIGKTLTEENGYYSYFGLVPGNYTVRIDTVQLHKLGMSSDPPFIKFDVKPGLEGEVVDKLDFTLKMNFKDTTNTAQKVLPERQTIRKDTTFMIVHEVTRELVSIPNDSYSIQLGAFKVRSNAESLRMKLQRLLGRKVDIITEDGLYKVRINDIKDRKEADDIIAKLQKNGITELWLINMRAMKQKLLIGQRQDTITHIIQTITKEPAQEADTSLIMQAGAFFQKSNAIALRDRLSQKLNQKVVIIYEDGYYKVRIITPYLLKNTVLDRIDSLMPTPNLKLKKVWIVPFQSRPLEEYKSKTVEVIPPVTRHENVTLKKAEVKILVPDTKQIISSMTLKENNIKTPAIVPQPTISIQAGIFYKKSEALKAQRRIKAKLNLNVEIEQQWDFYRVVIPGFYTREETYKYYPELAGLGYPGVSLIEKK